MSYMKILKKKICCIAVSVYEKSFHKALRLCLSFSAPGLDLTMDINLIIIGKICNAPEDAQQLILPKLSFLVLKLHQRFLRRSKNTATDARASQWNCALTALTKMHMNPP